MSLWLCTVNYCLQLAGVCGNGKLLPPIHPSCSSANVATHCHVLGQSPWGGHSPLLDRGHVAGFQHNQANAGWRHHASTSTAQHSDCTLHGHLQHSSQWCPQTVCQWHMALVFFSCILWLPETKYSTFNCELLAIYLGIHHFQFFLEVRPFTIFTDHKLLTFAMARMTDPW